MHDFKRYWQEWFVAALILAVLAAVLLLTGGCGSSTTDRQTQIVETQRTVTAPLVVESPFGQFTIQPAQVTVQRTQQEVETTQRTVDLPDVGAVITTAAAGTPWGGIISGIVGLGTAAFAAKKAVDNARQRDNVIDSMEAAKRNMDPETWDKVKTTMNDVQNDDTIAAVKARTA